MTKEELTISKDIMRACEVFRKSIFDQEEIEGVYVITSVSHVLLDDRPDAVIRVKKKDRYYMLLATDILKAIIVEDMDEFNPNRITRVLDLCDTHNDFLLPESFQVLGKYETQEFGAEVWVQTLIIKEGEL